MQYRHFTNILGAVSVLALFSIPALADSERKSLKAELEGFQEVPAISTLGNGRCKVKIGEDETSLKVTLDYSDLEGDVAQAHIHFGQPGVNGGVALFLCTNLGNGPVGTPACPVAPATVTRTLVAADVIGPSVQGIAAGELDEVLAAIRNQTAYCNVHTDLWPGGEIRGQLK